MNACTNPGCDHGTSSDGACIKVPDSVGSETFHCLYCACNAWRFNGGLGLFISPNWSEVFPYIQMQRYGRDNGRPRFEVKAPMEVLLRFVTFTSICPHCGSVMKFVRFRNKSKSSRNPASAPSPTGRCYLAVSCAYDDNKGCSKSSAAAAECDRLEAAIKVRDGAQPAAVVPKKPAQATLDLFPLCPIKTFKDLQTALRNIRYDITCGGCAELFFTGHGGAAHDTGCTTGLP